MAQARRTITVVTPTGLDLRRGTAAGLMVLGLVVAAATLVVLPAHVSRPMPSRSAAPDVLYTSRTSRLDAAEWASVKHVIHLRALALAPGRTALYRSVAAYMGLSALMQLHPVLPGRCATAVSYLYDNLLDLHNAYPGEDWTPLRRLIRGQPPVSACAPRARPMVIYVS